MFRLRLPLAALAALAAARPLPQEEPKEEPNMILVPRDGLCAPSDQLQSVTITTKDGNCKHTKEWNMLNPSLRLNVYNDDAAEALVRDNYPEALPTYKGLAHGVERADLFRYLAIHHQGGIYSDCDIEPYACVANWLTLFDWYEGREGLRLDKLLIVGLEFDSDAGWGFESLNNGTARNTSRVQLCQWAFAATAPGHPALMAVKDEVMARVRSIPDNSSNILDRTGPLAWTAGIMNYIQRYNVTGEELLSVRKLDQHGQLFKLRDQSGMASQVLILPYRAFGFPGAHGAGVQEGPTKQKLVHHMFEGSWKPGLRRHISHLIGFGDSEQGGTKASEPAVAEAMPQQVDSGRSQQQEQQQAMALQTAADAAAEAQEATEKARRAFEEAAAAAATAHEEAAAGDETAREVQTASDAAERDDLAGTEDGRLPPERRVLSDGGVGAAAAAMGTHASNAPAVARGEAQAGEKQAAASAPVPQPGSPAAEAAEAETDRAAQAEGDAEEASSVAPEDVPQVFVGDDGQEDASAPAPQSPAPVAQVPAAQAPATPVVPAAAVPDHLSDGGVGAAAAATGATAATEAAGGTKAWPQQQGQQVQQTQRASGDPAMDAANKAFEDAAAAAAQRHDQEMARNEANSRAAEAAKEEQRLHPNIQSDDPGSCYTIITTVNDMWCQATCKSSCPATHCRCDDASVRLVAL